MTGDPARTRWAPLDPLRTARNLRNRPLALLALLPLAILLAGLALAPGTGWAGSAGADGRGAGGSGDLSIRPADLPRQPGGPVDWLLDAAIDVEIEEEDWDGWAPAALSFNGKPTPIAAVAAPLAPRRAVPGRVDRPAPHSPRLRC